MKSYTSQYISCLHPIIVDKGTPNERYVSCGHCAACQVNKARKKASMITAESAAFQYKSFIMLTYNDESVPLVDILPRKKGFYQVIDARRKKVLSALETNVKSLNKSLKETKYVSYRSRKCVPVLKKEDIQKFIKRYKYIRRKENYDGPISYFVKGEYGPCTKRPHYHVCIFTNDKREHQSMSKNISLAWQAIIEDCHTISDEKLRGRKYKRKKRPLGGTNAEPAKNGFAGYAASYVSHPSLSCGIYALPQFSEFSTHNLRHGFSFFAKEIVKSEYLQYDYVHSFINPGITQFVAYYGFPASAERSLFPRCYRYVANSASSNLSLYALYPVFKSYCLSSGQQCDIKTIVNEYLYAGLPPYLSDILDNLLGFSEIINYSDYNNTDQLEELLYNRLSPSYYASRRFNENLKKFKLSPSAYLDIIDNYYAAKSYAGLIGSLSEISAVVENSDDYCDIVPLYYNEAIASPINRTSAADQILEVVKVSAEDTLHKSYKKRKYNDRVTHGFTILN